MHLKQFLIALDQVLNTLAGGWADETLSARAYRCQPVSPSWRRARAAIDALFFWQTEHCRGAYFSESARQQLPPEYRATEAAHG